MEIGHLLVKATELFDVIYCAKRHKFSRIFKSFLVSSIVVCFPICSIEVNSPCCWKLWPGSLKCLHANVDFFDLGSMIVQVDIERSLSFSKILRFEYSTLNYIYKIFTFTCKLMKTNRLIQ